MYSKGSCKEIFQEFSELFTGENDETVEALSFENFSHMNTKHSLFTTEKLGNFLKINGSALYINDESVYIQALQEISQKIEHSISEIRWRYFQVQYLENREEMLSILDIVQQQIGQLKKPQALLIAIKLMEQESKTSCISASVAQLLPKFCLGLITE